MSEDFNAIDARDHIFVARMPNSSTGAAFGAKMAGNHRQDWTLAVKSNLAVQGLPHTAGIGAYRNRIANSDAVCVARLRAAGMKILGTVNMDEAALGALTDNPHFGRTHNPRRHGYTPGGSSGGSAAAVAAGLARVALGSDTMGSCRIPAAYCGVVGFKPSFGRLSVRGLEPLCRRLDHIGILAETVDDVAAVFAHLDVFDIDDAMSSPCMSAPRSNATSLAVLDAAARATLAEDVRVAYECAIAALANHHEIRETAVDREALAAARRAGLLLCEAELSISLGEALARNDGGVSPGLRKLIEFGVAQSAPKLAAAHRRIDEAELVFRRAIGAHLALFWPTAPQSAFAFGTPAPANQADFTCLANFTGAPAISLPLRVAADALPVGGQFVMPKGRDHDLLQLASAAAPLVA
jgi:aspartyl-tRNA(Asn)/glutamyl-tRNA(Gln) amidotransferase subunit A